MRAEKTCTVFSKTSITFALHSIKGFSTSIKWFHIYSKNDSNIKEIHSCKICK